MNLTQLETEQFYKLWYALVWSINKNKGLIPYIPADKED